MIFEVYRADGSPDIRNWIIQCDNHCLNTISVLDILTSRWILGRYRNWRCYCPTCAEMLAMCLISWALACPACDSPKLTLGTDSNGIAEVILCDGECHSTYLAADGWHCTCCGNLISLPDVNGD
ncbi:hypothetical protein ACFWY5_37210 [Nonomuraea sp. NPDC059007]|uniref:hypothetical protein n=1 Tax=Nonomuraea sp. NPDC059007 TaxID=3346692 RepID=UPI0036B0B101